MQRNWVGLLIRFHSDRSLENLADGVLPVGLSLKIVSPTGRCYQRAIGVLCTGPSSLLAVYFNVRLRNGFSWRVGKAKSYRELYLTNGFKGFERPDAPFIFTPSCRPRLAAKWRLHNSIAMFDVCS